MAVPARKPRKLERIEYRAAARPAPGGDPLEFIMSDDSTDRMGDIIDQTGWQLENFKRNPIALFGHNAGFPIGTWHDVAVKDGHLQGRLELMPAVSERLAEVHTAIGAGVLRAVSVGFRPIKYEPLDEDDPWSGYRFTESELVECSLVSVPANPNALQVARALGITRSGLAVIFGGGLAANEDGFPGLRAISGGLAEASPNRKSLEMNISERIQQTHANINQARDILDNLLAADELDDEAIAEVNRRIGTEQTRLSNLENSERLLGSGAEAVNTGTGNSLVPYTGPLSQRQTTTPARPFAIPKKQEEPGYLIVRTALCQLLSHIEKKSPQQVCTERYGDDILTRGMVDWYVQRAATTVATTTQATWAAELAQIQYGEFFDALLPESIYTPLSGRGMRGTLGRFATIQMPTRALTPAIAGSFIAEGAPIPVRQGSFSTVPIGLKKMAVITTYTREMAEHSTPMIEMLLRQQIQDDTSIAIDSVLVDATAANSVRPAGLRSYNAGLTPTAGGGFNALVGDLKQLIQAFATINSMRRLVWIMNPVQAISIAFTQSSLGTFPFREEIQNNMLADFPVIKSSTCPLGTVILVDAADYVSLTGDDPRFEVSDQATLHMEDTTPLPIGTPGTPPTVAAPARSMFQTDSLALRMILPMNWIMRRPVVYWIAAVTW